MRPAYLWPLLGLSTLGTSLPASSQNNADPIALYARLIGATTANDCIQLQVDMASLAMPASRLEEDPASLAVALHDNDITEGWSWPEIHEKGGDAHFRFKYLPLASYSEERGTYRAEDMIGDPQNMQIRWRYDYFLAFTNLSDFTDASEALAVRAAELPPEQLQLRVEACLRPPVTRESTTFWKATHAKPVDFTLKKRYLVGELRQIDFIDARTGGLIARQLAQSKP